jgi:hypothetical protein
MPVRTLASRVVPETEFEVTYDGPALAGGQMPVRDLAPSLLALGELFTETSRVVYPDREPVALNVRATDEGSFMVNLSLWSPEAWNQVLQLLTSEGVTALIHLQALIFEGGGLLWLIQKARGQRIASQTPVPPGHVRVTLESGESFEVREETLALFNRMTARRKAQQVVAPLGRTGVERLDFIADGEVKLSINEADLPAYDVVEADERLLSEREDETVVAIVVASFEAAYKWRLSEGDTVFTASIDDPAFRSRIDKGEESFSKGDMLRVRMRVVQTQRPDGSLHVERTILEVIEHLPRLPQMSLGEDESEPEKPPDDGGVRPDES